MPSVTPCTFVNRKMHTMLLSHCFCCPKCNFLIWVYGFPLRRDIWLYSLNIPKALCVTKMFRHAPFLVNWFQMARILFLKLILHTSISYKFLDEVLWLVLYDYYRMFFSCGFLTPKAFYFINIKQSFL